MANLKIIVNEKVIDDVIIFNPFSLLFIRNKLQLKNTVISYVDGSGQSLLAGQTLFTSGVSGNVGFIIVKAVNNAILNGSGTFAISVEHYPSSTLTNQTVNFTLIGSSVNMNLTYTSEPVVNDIMISIDNRADFTFKLSNFSTKYNDYDGDILKEIAIFGNVDGLKLSGNQYVVGTWIPSSSIGSLVYTATNVDNAYEVTNTWVAKDITDHISANTAILNIKIAEAIAVNMICNESRWEKVNIPDLLAGKPPTFKIKGVGEFMFLFYAGYETIKNIIIRNKQSNAVVFNGDINHSKAFLITKTEVEDVTYVFNIYDVSGNSNVWYYAVSCAVPNDRATRVFFPNKLFLFNNNGVVNVNSFPVVIFNRQLTGFNLSYTYNHPPANFVTFSASGSTSSHKESDGNFTWIQEKLVIESANLPSVGTVQSGYNINVNLEGTAYNFNFAVQVINNPL